MCSWPRVLRRSLRSSLLLRGRLRKARVIKVRHLPPPTQHDAVAEAVVQAVTAANWGVRLEAEMNRLQMKAQSYYFEAPPLRPSPPSSPPSQPSPAGTRFVVAQGSGLRG